MWSTSILYGTLLALAGSPLISATTVVAPNTVPTPIQAGEVVRECGPDVQVCDVTHKTKSIYEAMYTSILKITKTIPSTTTRPTVTSTETSIIVIKKPRSTIGQCEDTTIIPMPTTTVITMHVDEISVVEFVPKFTRTVTSTSVVSSDVVLQCIVKPTGLPGFPPPPAGHQQPIGVIVSTITRVSGAVTYTETISITPTAASAQQPIQASSIPEPATEGWVEADSLPPLEDIVEDVDEEFNEAQFFDASVE